MTIVINGMDTLQINLKTPISSRIELNIGDITYNNEDGTFWIEIIDKSYLNLRVGQKIYYERRLYKGKNEHGIATYKTISEQTEIIEIINGNDNINGKIRVHGPVKKIYEVSSVDVIDDKYLAINFNKELQVFAQDLVSFSGYTMNIWDSNDVCIAIFSGNTMCVNESKLQSETGETQTSDFYVYQSSDNTLSIPTVFDKRPINIYDCIIEVGEELDCTRDECNGKLKVYDYIFLPPNINSYSILAKPPIMIDKINNLIINNAKYVTFSFNTFFYKNEDVITFYSDNWVEEAVLKEDVGLPKTIYDWSNVCKNEGDDNYTAVSGINTCVKILSSDSRTSLVIYENYYEIDLGLSLDSNDLMLEGDNTFSDIFVDDIIDDLVPEVIDMERLKYSPGFLNGEDDGAEYYVWYTPDGINECNTKYIYTPNIHFNENEIIDNNSETIKNIYIIGANGEMKPIELHDDDYFIFAYEYGSHFENGKKETLYRVNGNRQCTYYLSDEKYNNSFVNATSIAFYLHFIKRDEIKDAERATMNTVYTSGNVYYDTWHVNSEYRDYTWWNEYDSDSFYFDPELFGTFYRQNGLKSDLIGYLNFTDNDVYYRKKKISQSFLRLSFYTSKDPIEQKLLYYSTIFLDGSELYNKYMRQMRDSEFIRLRTLNEKRNDVNRNAFGVLYSGDIRIDSKIKVTNEYNKLKSSEGFNLYLFAQDKNFNLENGVKTIYMKVEFNHAGNGKTLPLVMWPKDGNGDFCPLTTDNYFDSLYIPVKLSYINGRYVYSIVGSERIDNEIAIVLFEPKLDMLPDEIELPEEDE